MSKITDYPGAVERIWDAEGDGDALFKQDVIDALLESQHVNDRTAREIADNGVATIENVQAALEKEGEIPDAVDIASTIQDNSMVDDGSRSQQMTSDLANQFVTQSDIEEAVNEVQSSDGTVFRQDVEETVNDKTATKQWVGADESQATSDVAEQLGAPDRETFQQQAVQAIAANERKAEDYDTYDGGGERVNVVENTSGEVIGVTGGSKKATQAVAEAEGAEAITGNPMETFDVAQSNGNATLTLNGEPVTDIDV